MGNVLYSNKIDSLRTLSTKIKKVLNKAQDQFQERHSNIQQGYITDLR